MPVKVCILTTVHQVFDVRIFYKQAKTLVQAGYKVTLIAQHNKNEVIDGVRIIALHKPKNRFMRIFSFTWRILYLAITEKADIYHFHDPELIFIGILLKFLGKKVIYDIHEDVPKQIMYKGWLGNNQIRKIAAFIMNIIEQTGGLFFNKLVAATPDIARKFPRNKTIILRNFPIVKLIDDMIPADYIKSKSIIIYGGGLMRVRGIKEMIQAMKYIDNRAEFWLLGRWDNEKFKKECENLYEWKYVKYFGFISLEKVYQYMKIADIGISIIHPVENHLKALPNKCFEYMACSLPIVISNFPYWKENFRGCALFADPYDPKDIAEKILFLLGNIKVMNKMGKNGRKLIVVKFSWEEESKKLLEIYKHIL